MGGWVVSITPLPRFTPGERTPGTHCKEKSGKILCPRRASTPDRPVVQPVVRHYTAWAKNCGPWKNRFHFFCELAFIIDRFKPKLNYINIVYCILMLPLRQLIEFHWIGSEISVRAAILTGISCKEFITARAFVSRSGFDPCPVVQEVQNGTRHGRLRCPLNHVQRLYKLFVCHH
jgi:hypothetical protein